MLKLKKTNRPAPLDQIKKTHLALKKFMARDEIGFKDLPFRDPLWVHSAKVGRQIGAEATDIVLIGIGGSSLGPQLIAELSNSLIKVHFADNVDPWQFQKICQAISNWQKCHFLIISKSGSTLETLFTAGLFDQELSKRSLKLCDRSIVITELRANPLKQWADNNSVQVLEVPVDVGGRFSILSPVGMVLAEALGFSIDEIRKGAHQALESREAIEEISAEALASFDRQEWITFIWNYSSGLRYFGLWFQQLWAESLAKSVDFQQRPAARVSTPVAAIGTCDQHSLLQQVMEGAKDKWVMQIRVATCESEGPLLDKSPFSALDEFGSLPLGKVLAAEAEATARALEQSGISLRVFELQDLGPRSIGYLLMFWQLVVACVGESLELNAFDQPGVELGKRLAKDILRN